jgi:hypothetical protein
VSCTYISDGKDLYVNVHPTRRELLRASWLRTSSNTVLTGAQFPFRPDQFDDDPDRFFRDLEEAGSATIGGVATTRYRGRFDTSSLVPGASAAPVVSQFADGIAAELYIDADGLLRRMELQLARSAGVEVLIRMDLYDYGKAVDIKVPPANQTRDSDTDTTTACFPATAAPGG